MLECSKTQQECVIIDTMFTKAIYLSKCGILGGKLLELLWSSKLKVKLNIVQNENHKDIKDEDQVLK